MRELIQVLYIDDSTAEANLEEHRVLVSSPSVGLAVRTTAKAREAALKVATAHSLGFPDLPAMTSLVQAMFL